MFNDNQSSPDPDSSQRNDSLSSSPPSLMENDRNDQKTFVISLAALIFSSAGYATSIFALFVSWLVPNAEDNLPRLSNPLPPNPPSPQQTILRPPSPGRLTSVPNMTARQKEGSLFRPNPNRHVSFSLEHSQTRQKLFVQSTQVSLASSPLDESFVLPSSPWSSVSSDSSTLLSTPSSQGRSHDVALPCFDDSCACASSSGSLLLSPSSPSSFKSSPLSSLSQTMRLPKVKKVLSGKRAKTLDSASPPMGIVEFSPPLVLSENTMTENSFGLEDGLRSSFSDRLRPKPQRFQTSPNVSPMEKQPKLPLEKLHMGWPLSRRTNSVQLPSPATTPDPQYSPTGSATKPVTPPPRRSLVRRLTNSQQHSPERPPSSGSSYLSTSERRRSVQRTQPCPPYNEPACALTPAPAPKPRRPRGIGRRSSSATAAERGRVGVCARALNERLHLHLRRAEDEDLSDGVVVMDRHERMRKEMLLTLTGECEGEGESAPRKRSIQHHRRFASSGLPFGSRPDSRGS